MNIALIHDHLAQDGGAEQILKAFQGIYPHAPTYVIVYNPQKANPHFSGKDIRTSFIQRLPFGVKHYRWFLSIMPQAVESYSLGEFNCVLSSASFFAKGVITRPETLHISYCHTPTRFLWSDTHSYVEDLHYPPVLRKIIPLSLTRLRMWDRLSADRVDDFIANSRVVQKRIQKYYRRGSHIIHPPVETDKFSIRPRVGDYFLMGGRLVAYKRFDLGIRAFNRLGIPLKIFGVGPELRYLQNIARPNIEFLGKISEEEKARVMGEAIAFINPQEEDFGIVTVESMAAGRPVVAYRAGGAIEIVIPGKTGVFFHEQRWESLADAVIRFQAETFDPHVIQVFARTFDIRVFQDKIRAYVDQRYTLFRSSLL